MQALNLWACFLLQILAIPLYSQNLVYNGSFEELYPNPAKRCFSTNDNTEHLYASTSNVYALMKPEIERNIRLDICSNKGIVYYMPVYIMYGNSGITQIPRSAADGKRFARLELWEENHSGNNWAGMWLGKAVGMEMQELQIGRRYRFSAMLTAGPEILNQCDYDGFGVAFSCSYMHDVYCPDGFFWRYSDLLDSVFLTKDSLVLSHYGRFFRYPRIVKPGPWKEFTFEFTADSAYCWLALGRLMVPLGLADKCKRVSENEGGYFIDDVRIELLDREPKIEGPTEICAGDSLLLRNANGDTVYFEAEPIRRFPVQWLDASGKLLDSSVNLRVKPIASTWYVARYAMESDTHWVVVHPRPDLRILSEEKGCGPAGRPHTLRGAVSSQQYHWTPPDTTAWRIQTFDTSRIRIRVSTAAGCVDSTSYLPQDSCGYLLGLYIPNALYTGSPHGNTGLEISHPAIESLQLSIYNRWGAKIADLQGANSVRWQPDSDIMQGVYAWRCTARYRDSRNTIQTDYLQGTVHVFR
jgi:hypothetical protein